MSIIVLVYWGRSSWQFSYQSFTKAGFFSFSSDFMGLLPAFLLYLNVLNCSLDSSPLESDCSDTQDPNSESWSFRSLISDKIDFLVLIMSAAMEQAGGLSVRDKLYLLTNALLEEKSGGARPGKDNIEVAEIDFIKGCTLGCVIK